MNDNRDRGGRSGQRDDIPDGSRNPGGRPDELPEGFDARLRESLASVDAWAAVESAPDLSQFERMVADHKRKLRRAWRRELAVFLLAALWIVSGTMFMLARQPALFIGLQVVFAAGVLAVYPALERKLRGGREE